MQMWRESNVDSRSEIGSVRQFTISFGGGTSSEEEGQCMISSGGSMGSEEVGQILLREIKLLCASSWKCWSSSSRPSICLSRDSCGWRESFLTLDRSSLSPSTWDKASSVALQIILTARARSILKFRSDEVKGRCY